MTSKLNKHNIVIVDDHLLFAESLENLINTFSDFHVLFNANNGKHLQQKLKNKNELPSIILLDINMPVMDGFETMEWLSENYPDIKVLALSMDDEEATVLKILRKGANGYLLKDIHPDKLKVALEEVLEKGYYHSEMVATSLINSLNTIPDEKEPPLKENEFKFLKLSCTEMTYKEIADIMNLSPKTIDGYRNDLFKKLNIKNRVGLVIYALKNKIFEI